MGSRKRRDLLSKLRAWGPWERIEWRGEAGKGAEKNVELNKNQLKKEFDTELKVKGRWLHKAMINKYTKSEL